LRTPICAPARNRALLFAVPGSAFASDNPVKAEYCYGDVSDSSYHYFVISLDNHSLCHPREGV
jgi:hypothetical protein